jgi:CRP-like cAMP-binding protein
MSDIISTTITQSPLFKHLSDDDMQSIVDAASIHEYDDADPIIEEGGSVRHLYVLVDGKVRVWTKSLEREVDLKTLGKGAYFGEVSLMSGKAATATVEAQGNATVLAIDKATVLELVERDEKVRKMLEGLTLARAKDTLGKVLK